jgi:hypothetical protein
LRDSGVNGRTILKFILKKWDFVVWNHLAPDIDQQQSFMKIGSFGFLKMWGIFYSVINSFSRRTLLHGVH